MKANGIYRILNLINGHFYIGQSSDLERRKTAHWSDLRKGKHDNRHLQNSWNKYGEKAFVFQVMVLCEKHELMYYEQQLVDKCIPYYNIMRKCVTTPLGVKRSKVTKKKHSDGQVGSKNHRFGTHPSIETREKLSKIHTGMHMSDKTCKKHALARLGKHLSEETKKKISEAHKGKRLSSSTLMKLSAERRGEKNVKAKLTENDVVKIRLLRNSGVSAIELSKIFSISKSVIYGIVAKRLWRCVP